MKHRLLLLGFLFVLMGCDVKREVNKPIGGSIYHWKSTYDPDSTSLEKLDQLKICKQYIRFFDVDRDKESGEAVPRSIVRFRKHPAGEVVPVVYLTNRTFKDLNPEKVKKLASNTIIKINEIADLNKLNYKSLQLDCDWSRSTKEAYFNFLKEIQKALPGVSVSATLRLHQIKFMEQTGVPPVDRTTLMLYNVGDWTNPLTQNSLFDPQIIDQYIYRIPEYPLPIDIALPIFQQTLVYRNDKLYTFLKNKPYAAVSEAVNLKPQKKAETYVCEENCRFLNISFRKGDVFRFESVNFDQLERVNDAVLQRLHNNDAELVLYHLDKFALSQFSQNQLRELLN